MKAPEILATLTSWSLMEAMRWGCQWDVKEERVVGTDVGLAGGWVGNLVVDMVWFVGGSWIWRCIDLM